MNELIEAIFANFTVNGVRIPVTFLYYNGHGEPYVTYMEQDMDNSYSGDDELLGYVDFYDFDVYSKGNYLEIQFIDTNNGKFVNSHFSETIEALICLNRTRDITIKP